MNTVCSKHKKICNTDSDNQKAKKKKTQTKMVYVKFAGKLKQTLWWQAAEGQKQIANDETLPIINAILCYPIWRRFLPFFSSAIKFSLFSFLGAEKFLTPPPQQGVEQIERDRE